MAIQELKRLIDADSDLAPAPTEIDAYSEAEDDGYKSAQSDHEDDEDVEIIKDTYSTASFQHALETHHDKIHDTQDGDIDQTATQDKYVQKNEKIIDRARDYQQELFERAKEENFIAVLDTGMGKTLIAAMLIRHALEQDLFSTAKGNKPKTVFFLANRYLPSRDENQAT